MFLKLFSQITIFQVNNLYEIFTVHQMVNNPKPLKEENHIVLNSENINFKTEMPELENYIKKKKLIQLLF